MSRTPSLALLVGTAVMAACLEAQARVLLSQSDALNLAFPAPTTVERRTLYLSDDQARRTAEVAGAPVEIRVVPYYVGARDGRITGHAYFDTHLVRTLPETVMIVVSPSGSIARIDILSFEEPPDYLPGGRWLQQFPGKSLEPSLTLNQQIRTLTGATLSSRAVTQAARRVLAIHRLWVEPVNAGSPR